MIIAMKHILSIFNFPTYNGKHPNTFLWATIRTKGVEHELECLFCGSLFHSL